MADLDKPGSQLPTINPFDSSLSALRELDDIGRRFQIGRFAPAPVSSRVAEAPSSYFSRGPLGLDLQLGPSRHQQDSPPKVQRSSMAHPRESFNPTALSKISSLLPTAWRVSMCDASADALQTPSKLKKSVCFAESPRTGRVKTATKRFYIGEAIHSPGPPSLLSEESIYDVSPLQNRVLKTEPAQRPPDMLDASLTIPNSSSLEVPLDPGEVRIPQKAHSPDTEKTQMRISDDASFEAETTAVGGGISLTGEREQIAPSTPISTLIQDFGTFVLSFGKTYLRTPQRIAATSDNSAKEALEPSPASRPSASSANYASWLRGPLSSPMRLFRSQQQDNSYDEDPAAHQLRLEALEAMKDNDNMPGDADASDSDDPLARDGLPTQASPVSRTVYTTTNPFLDDSEDELGGDVDKESASHHKQEDPWSDEPQSEGESSEEVAKCLESEDIDTEKKVPILKREPSLDLPARLSGLTLLKSPAIIPSPRRSSRRLSLSRQYRAEKVQRIKNAADQYARDHGILRQTKNSMVPALSTEAMIKLKEALRKRPGEIVAVTSTRIEISRRDIGKVLPQMGTGDDASGWLNDEILGAYLQCAVDYGNEKRRVKGTPKYHAFNTFFYTKLSSRKGYDDVKRWASRAKIGGKELLKVEYVFIPINRGGSHWGLGVISPVRRTIEYYDSLHYPASSVYDNLQTFLRGELGTAYVEDDWRILEDEGHRGAGKGPSQDNARDCGVFASTTAKMVVLGVDPCMVTARDMPLQRRRMVAEIINGGFVGEMAPHVEFVYEDL